MKKIYLILLMGCAIASSAKKSATPQGGAPAPTFSSDSVTSLFSDMYTDVTVDTWRTSWSNATLTDTSIGGDNMKRYSSLDFVGVEAVGANSVDASGMNYLHLDVWVSAGTLFRVKLVDFGADNAFGGGDDSEHEIVDSMPTTDQWISYHIHLDDFSGLASREHLSQFIFSAQPAGSADVFIDNVFFSKEPMPATEPSTSAATPTSDQSDVISLFSGIYNDVNVDTWRTSWSNATLDTHFVMTDMMWRYSSLDFVGVEAVGANSIDASEMEYFNLDIWTPDATLFRVKLVDFGADNAFGGGDDSEHEIVDSMPGQGTWVNYHIELNDFTGLASTEHISQIIFSAQPAGGATVFVDNVYFDRDVVIPAPMTAAAHPTNDPADVISMFCDTFTDVTVDTWRTSWSSAELEDIMIGTNNVKKYSNLDFVGIEAVGANAIDASGMDHINFDAWSPNATLYRIKLVDFGADNAFGGGDDSEHEIAFDMPATETWNNHKIDLDSFTGLTGNEHISQIIFSAQPTASTIFYLDNLFFSSESTATASKVHMTSFNVYPNPASTILNVQAQSADLAVEKVTISNIQGQLVYSEILNAKAVNTQIDVANLAKGMYVVQLHTARGIHATRITVQ